MMLRGWRERWRRARQASAAENLQAWLDTAGTLLAACQDPLRSRSLPPDIGVPLDRIDRLLMRFRSEAAVVRSPLRPRPELAARVRLVTDGLFELRNQTCGFLLRWQTAHQLEQRNTLSIDAQRNMEEARLLASRGARRLSDEWTQLAPELEALIGEWRLAVRQGPPPPAE